ncbi:MAG: nitrate reductase [Acidiferrobacteraceae bacterium]
MTEAIRTACPYCGVGCGIVCVKTAEGGVSIQGDSLHPANHGRLCGKGLSLLETVGLHERLLRPRLGGRECSWDEALDFASEGLLKTVQAHGPDAVAFYVSGQLLTEDYYVANKLMKGFIGSANIDTNSRLCMSSSVAGHVRAFGEDIVPGCYEDLDLAELVIFAGSNAAWCHPVLYQRIKHRKTPPFCVVIDPRRSATATSADLHLPLKPGTDVLLWNGLLAYLHRNAALDLGFLETRAAGFADAIAAAHADADSVPQVAAGTGLSESDVARFFHLFAAHERVVTLYSQGVNQSSSGTDKVNAILNCHLATGRIGRPGMGPLSLTGQPNAMGGREVGGTSTQLAAHMGFGEAECDRVQRFWGAPHMARSPGLKAVELFDAVASGKVRALWIMATNPVDSQPNADHVRRALSACPLVIVSDCHAATDTTGLAHCLLPALSWGEKEGMTTNSERCMTRQRRFLEPPEGPRADWRIICDIAHRMGFGSAFTYRGPADIFREHAMLSGLDNDGTRAFDIASLAHLSDAEYEHLPPTQWPITPEGATARLCATGRFPSADGRAHLVALAYRPPKNGVSDRFPLVLNTGRVRDHWHTLTRTGHSPRLSRHASAPYVEVSPLDLPGAREHDLATVTTAHGHMIARVRPDPHQQRGSVFVPIHWNDQFARAARVGALVNAVVDPLSGQPELKHTPCRVERLEARWHAILYTRRPPRLQTVDYWVRSQEEACIRYELAGLRTLHDPQAWLRDICALSAEDVVTEYADARAGQYRAVVVRGERLQACLYLDFERLPGTNPAVAARFRRERLSAAERIDLLARVPSAPERVLCACFQTTDRMLRAAMTGGGCRTIDALARSLGAGSRCGSCLPELRALLASGPPAASGPLD